MSSLLASGSGTMPYDVDGGEFSSQRFESFSSYVEVVPDHDLPYAASDDVFGSTERDANGPILPPMDFMQPEDGFALREWRRENAVRLEAKEKREKEVLGEIIEEAEEYKAEYYRKWSLKVENNKAVNREKEKLFLESQEKFHGEASKNYWKAIGELIPKEVATIEKKGKNKDRASIVVIQGPKPGKPTDLSRMRQVLGKLKQNPPPHMKTSPLVSDSPSASQFSNKSVAK